MNTWKKAGTPIYKIPLSLKISNENVPI